MSWRTRFRIAVLIALAASAPAPAQQNVPNNLTVVGEFYESDSSAVLFVITTKATGGNAKGAGLGVQFKNLDADYRFNGTYSKLIALFPSANDWRKFVAIWKKARSGQETKDDDYFDSQTIISVSPDRDGSVRFILGGNGLDENNVPKDMTIFDLRAKDLPEFDRDVKQVSAYFTK